MKKAWPPHSFRARVRFLSSEEGGRKGPTGASGRYGCPMMWARLPKGHAFDVFFNLDESGPISPGQELEANLWFLSPKEALPLIEPGTKFQLWEIGTIAHGEVISVNTKGESAQPN